MLVFVVGEPGNSGPPGPTVIQVIPGNVVPGVGVGVVGSAPGSTFPANNAVFQPAPGAAPVDPGLGGGMRPSPGEFKRKLVLEIHRKRPHVRGRGFSAS